MRIVLLAAVFLIVFLTGCVTTPKPPLTELQALKAQGQKRLVVFNRKQFLKPGGVVTMSPTAVMSLAKNLNATDWKPLDQINGFTMDVPETSELNLGLSDWVVQEEIEHSIFQTCQRVTPIACPVTPGPTPTPTPTPVPTPTPNPGAKSWGISKVRAIEAQALVDTSNVKVCIIDTGIDMSHPLNGQVIASIGYAGAVQDRQGHGTHVAGTVAGQGGYGVAPKSKLLICKGLSDSGSGSSSQLAQCLTWCGQQGAQVVSNSWGSPQSDSLINSAIQGLTNQGIHVLVANGNDGRAVNWPAKLSGSNPLVYAVAASGQNDQITSFSSRGPETKIISPGAGIISNWPGGGQRSLDGTSMATPHAAGICAFGVAKGLKPCFKASGTVSGYPFADALSTVQ